MSGEPVIRPARPDEGDLVAELLYETAGGMYDLFAGGRDRAARILRAAYVRRGNSASHEVVSLAEMDGELIRPVVQKKLPALPPGGCGVAYVDGVARGHLLAAERGADGQRYILCDRHVSLRAFAEGVVRAAHRGRAPATMPVPVAHAVSLVGEGVARALRKPPLLPRGQLLFFLWDAAPDSSKAQDELGWEPTLLEDGLAAAVAAL